MDEHGNLTHRQPDFDLIVKKDYWTIEYAVRCLTKYYLRDKKYKLNESGDNRDELVVAGKKDYAVVYSSLINIVEGAVSSKDLLLNDRVTEEAYDEDGCPYAELNLLRSRVAPINFVFWAVRRKLQVPEEFKAILPFYNTKGSTDKIGEVGMFNEFPDGFEAEDADDKYPDYKELKFEGLPKAKFDELKRQYGMLRGEESKWRRGVAIAAKIGLLFYERGLNKPTTRAAFLTAYKPEFDAVLQNDSLAKHIYRNLPESYQGVTKAPVNPADIETIVKAATLGGYSVGGRDVDDLNAFKKMLSREKYIVPDDTVLEVILATVEKLEGYNED
jgi:hypothetical protein